MEDLALDPNVIAERLSGFLDKGGVTIWLIAGLSVVTLAIILWKIWRLSLMGAWSRRRSENALRTWISGDRDAALGALTHRRSARAKVSATAMRSVESLAPGIAREETTRIARNQLAEASKGLRALELIATIAPLLGLLGTVLGMITAFQTLQEAGSRADPSALAGGIWEALLTTAAGMAVAIPASAALSWFESVIDGLRLDIEDAATQIFTRAEAGSFYLATEKALG